MTFPENVTVHPLDRVDLQRMFKVVGNDFTCPNVWGCTRRETNDDSRVNYKISLLRGLPPSVLRATCAHELTHTWINENPSREREQRISPDAKEGFCELIACLYCEAQGDQAQLGVIKSNAYSRGQFTLFREAERRFGMNDVVDWMKYGTDDRLMAEDLRRVRNVDVPPATAASDTNSPAYGWKPASEPDTLVLKAITWSQPHPVAMINNRTFTENEQGKVRVGKTNLTLRCLSIRPDAVRIQIVGSGEQRELRLRTPSP
jgi:hypothetical protein